MIAFPIPTSEPVPPFLGILIMIVATAVFVVGVVVVVRYFRNSGGGHDVFGPEVPRDDQPRDDQPRDPKDAP